MRTIYALMHTISQAKFICSEITVIICEIRFFPTCLNGTDFFLCQLNLCFVCYFLSGCNITEILNENNKKNISASKIVSANHVHFIASCG